MFLPLSWFRPFIQDYVINCCDQKYIVIFYLKQWIFFNQIHRCFSHMFIKQYLFNIDKQRIANNDRTCIAKKTEKTKNSSNADYPPQNFCIYRSKQRIANNDRTCIAKKKNQKKTKNSSNADYPPQNVCIYRSSTVNSKSFVGKVLLQIKWKFELINAL